MTRMCQSLELFVLSSLFLTGESQLGHILPPQNVSLKWMSDFDPQLSWAPPPHSVENCKYAVEVNTKNDDDFKGDVVSGQSWQLYFVMKGGFLEMTVQTVCGIHRSEQVKVNADYPVLVRDLECYIYSATQTYCSWHAASQAQDLRFYYWLTNEDSQRPVVDKPSSRPLLECSSYLYNDVVRTGCVLEEKIHHHSIDFLFNGTLNDTFARNTFRRMLIKVRPPPLNWTVTKTTDRFHIKWTPPNISLPWRYTIKYTECNEPKIKPVIGGNSTDLYLDPKCQYRMTIKAHTKRGETPESDEKYFDADTDPDAWLYAAIIIPLMLAGLAALLFVCCRKNKKYIFPKVPEPRDLLSDISNNNNNKSTVHKLYVPPEEEDNSEITLVVDALINRLDV